MAVTEMVSEHNWAPDFFGSQEVWSPRNLDPEKFSPRMKIIIWHFHAEANILGAQIFGNQISRGPKKSGSQMRSKTISVIPLNPYFLMILSIPFNKSPCEIGILEAAKT